MKKLLIILAGILLFSASCTNNKQEKISIKYMEDTHSYAQPSQAVITHLDLDIYIDFNQKIISGTANYEIENNNSSEIILDGKNLDIEKIQEDGNNTEFSLGEFNKLYGQALIINIKKSTKRISIHYKTTAKSEALQWLNPQQTSDKTHPFLFTMGFPIQTPEPGFQFRTARKYG